MTSIDSVHSGPGSALAETPWKPAKPAAKAPMVRTQRRVIVVAGPVHKVFARHCQVLGLDQQQVSTRLVEGWNRRQARRVQRRLEQQLRAARLACGDLKATS